MLNRRRLLQGLATAAAAGPLAAPAIAQSGPVKIGFILPMTGPSASTGRQVEAAVKLFLAQNGKSFGGKQVELIVRDDTATADVTRRIAQEMIVNDKVAFLAGFGLTPLAFATAPIATQAKVPMLVTCAATAIITEKSPYIVRSSFTLPQVTIVIADWAAKNGIKKVATLVADYAPGLDAEKAFKERFTKAGGEVVADTRVPLRNPDYAPFLQRASDTKPDALFVFVPAGFSAQFMKQFVERGLDKSGIKLIGTGDVTDDDVLNEMGEPALGTVTSHHYSAAHPSEINKTFVAAFEKAYPGMRPNFMGVGGWDGMHLMTEALKKTGGDVDGTKLVEAMKGMSYESVRGPITIDPQTRDIIQDVYIRKVERQNGQLYNIEFDKVAQVKDPVKAGQI